MDRYERLGLGCSYPSNYFRCKDKHTQNLVVVKRVVYVDQEDGIPGFTLREISILKQLKHPNLVDLRDVCQGEGILYLIYEFVDKNLKECYQDWEGPLTPRLVKSYCYQMLSGLHFCHARGVMHRNLNPRNMLVSSNGRLKLSGFSIARSFLPKSGPLTHEVMILWYRAPEILLGCENYSLPVDLWAIGTTIAEMVRKVPLFPGDSEIGEIFKIFGVLGTPNNYMWPGVTALPDWNEDFPVFTPRHLSNFVPGLSAFGIDILERMISLDPRQRITCKEALAHPYFADLADEEM